MTRGSFWQFGVLLGFLAGCAGGSQLYCPQDPATGMSQCTTASTSAGDAIAITGLAAGVYAVTGCTANGCQLPDRCNTKTKRCEPIHCSVTQTCPAGYHCDFETTLCR